MSPVAPKTAGAAMAARLGVDVTAGKLMLPCVFHPDTQASLSVDLDRGVFYCFGGCPEPKGGGAILFLQRWAQYREGKTLSRREAGALLIRGGRALLPNIPTVSQIQEEARAQERRDFASTATAVFADQLRSLEHLRDLIYWALAAAPFEDDDLPPATWDFLAQIDTQIAWCESGWLACRSDDPALIDAWFTELVALDLWTPEHWTRLRPLRRAKATRLTETRKDEREAHARRRHADLAAAPADAAPARADAADPAPPAPAPPAPLGAPPPRRPPARGRPPAEPPGGPARG